MLIQPIIYMILLVVFFVFLFKWARKFDKKVERKQQVRKESKDNIVNKVTSTNVEDIISSEGKFVVLGARGRELTIFDNKVIIATKAGVGSFITGNVTDGEKTIYYSDVIGVQFKESGVALGYLQLETSSGLMNNKGSNFFNENSFTWDTTTVTNDVMRKIADYIQMKIEMNKQSKNQPSTVINQVSNAEELKKYKELLDSGVINQEEFDAKKKQLLGL